LRTNSKTPLYAARLFRVAGAIVTTAALLAGCGGTGKMVPPTAARAPQSVPFDGPLSSAEHARIAAMEARVAARLATGYVFKTAGTATSAIVRADGTSSITLGSAHFIRISVVPKAEGGDRITLDGPKGRSVQAETPSCQDDCGSDTGGGTPTPDPQPSPPPNFSSCSASGGATWFDNSSGNGGCLGPGASRSMSCGTWSYSSPGKGKFTFRGGGVTFDGVDWISDNGDGSCGLG